uniref:Uncharacterized protein n=1 Tax=Arundo donax TaxID=35708 RepID=A0A0A9CCB0_ARUDO
MPQGPNHTSMKLMRPSSRVTPRI